MKPDRFDTQAETLVQQLAISGETFNDLKYVKREIAAALRAAVLEAFDRAGYVIVPKEPR